MAYRETVELCGAIPAGAVIGKKACNVKWISQQSGGARLIVNAEEDNVVVSARSRGAVDAAVRLLRAQIEANKRLGTYGSWVFAPALPMGIPCEWTMYCWRATSGPTRGSVFFLQESGTGGTGRINTGAFYTGAMYTAATGLDNGVLAATLEDAALKAARKTPRFDVLKMRFNLGKQYFYNLDGLAKMQNLTLDDIKGLKNSPSKSNSVFSNYVPASTVPRVTSWLTDVLGFSLTDTKTTATLHVIDAELNVQYTVALTLPYEDEDEEAGCYMVKLQGGRREGLDLRMKLLGQRRELEDRASGRPLRLKLSVVEVEENTGGKHTEITGTVPELDSQLAQLLQEAPEGSGSGSDVDSECEPAGTRSAAAETYKHTSRDVTCDVLGGREGGKMPAVSMMMMSVMHTQTQKNQHAHCHRKTA
ncbi:hypothetical protein VOLCADRAFT_93963 [Volvox carteri f. nagariensis]|uniref:K Homology domain-containing protein n=1 Tax=Volvox carteri f. nagariensis TaxID=3068 RepID=D8U3J4_VOLCA|nr:uncharacterized protein VOLCADRAFT_93963 [Volvox carteri f. nagariensis]EFJ45832.1 hypothetical protein VOLCADRAFT_93963 [Volvox carteri f. nagariensis]|eukprot:XP_002953233.1 hypothetical protein VOLCADRAFT_93963 [Volvox carteri f. nagariensis]